MVVKKTVPDNDHPGGNACYLPGNDGLAAAPLDAVRVLGAPHARQLGEAGHLVAWPGLGRAVRRHATNPDSGDRLICCL